METQTKVMDVGALEEMFHFPTGLPRKLASREAFQKEGYSCEYSTSQGNCLKEQRPCEMLRESVTLYHDRSPVLILEKTFNCIQGGKGEKQRYTSEGEVTLRDPQDDFAHSIYNHLTAA